MELFDKAQDSNNARRFGKIMKKKAEKGYILLLYMKLGAESRGGPWGRGRKRRKDNAQEGCINKKNAFRQFKKKGGGGGSEVIRIRRTK